MNSPQLKFTFLGSGSAFTVGENNYQSNVLIQDLKTKAYLLIDCGGDARFSLFEQGLTHADIDSVYISHIHADHVGGLEWLGFTRYFSNDETNLYISNDITAPLWETLKAGMSTLDKSTASIRTFFNVHEIDKDRTFTWQEHHFSLQPTIHVLDNGKPKPCYGLLFEINNNTVLYTADSRYCYSKKKALFDKASIIFHDCETSEFKSGVHSHYDELLAIPEHIRKKMWLYHYNPGPKPDPIKDGFQGFVQKGQTFLF